MRNLCFLVTEEKKMTVEAVMVFQNKNSDRLRTLSELIAFTQYKRPARFSLAENQ